MTRPPETPNPAAQHPETPNDATPNPETPNPETPNSAASSTAAQHPAASSPTTQGPATANLRAARDTLVALRESYDEAVATFAWPDVGDTFNWGTDWFDAIARGNPREALVIVEEDGRRTTRTFDELATRSDQLGTWLAGLGVQRGDVVMLMLGNQVELWESMLAVMKLGAVILPTTVAVGSAELATRIARGGVRHVIADHAVLAKFDAVPGPYTRIATAPDAAPSTPAASTWQPYAAAFAAPAAPLPHPGTAPNDPLLLYFTSGTTSQPKLVEHTQVSYPVGHLTTMYWLGLRPGDIHLAISSPGWAKHAWSCFFAPWIAEATVFVYNYSRFDPQALLGQIRAEKVTSFCAPPTVWRMLIRSDLSGGPGALREAISAGEPLNPEVISQVRQQWGLSIRDGYGQTEMTAVVANTPGATITDGSMGRPLPGCPIVIVDVITGARAEEGEICVDLSTRPLNLMTGYVGDAARNEEAESGGYYRTGDVAARDVNGYITYIGRTDDVFKASDYKISPFELESVLVEHPAVLESAIVPAPDALRLAVPKAYVTLAPGFSPSADTARDILLYARQRLAPFQRIRRVEFFDLPKTISGKIRRVELREREEQVAEGLVAPTEWRDDEFPELKNVTQ
ncbi:MULTISPECIES: AMP-binding protein [Subtercola]|uniref:AMP-dependent synthetase n=1 Tax=Subtercola vilae TaxID=2056433 RepID=A0A4T2BYD6_9MICO|nr:MULTISPECIES: AMP-binding protein [Subtercola]MEA9987217.1 AMP-binding protein [Subtercola sp. RTI3]TIH36600.1 AMP-dependent synthetase [Subtercola vilae]